MSSPLIMKRRSQTAAALAVSVENVSDIPDSEVTEMKVEIPIEPKIRVPPIVFNDEENLVLVFNAAQYNDTITNTACLGPAKDEKDRVWELISQKLKLKINGTERTPEQVRARWKSMRSSYNFKENKTQCLAEMYYNRIKNTNHTVRYSDVTMPQVTQPKWLASIIRSDHLMRQHPNQPPQAVKRASTSIKETNIPKSKKPRHNDLANRPYLVNAETVMDHSPTRSPSVHKDYSNITEWAEGTSSATFYDETEIYARRRRDEELHVANLALLHAKRLKSEAHTRYLNELTNRLQTLPASVLKDLPQNAVDCDPSEFLQNLLSS